MVKVLEMFMQWLILLAKPKVVYVITQLSESLSVSITALTSYLWWDWNYGSGCGDFARPIKRSALDTNLVKTHFLNTRKQ